ncbi:hypothetical protein BBEV_2535 [Salisediminibacterium beveridgei]|uniref:Uncharacterized protein n=2 Tax=Salisediminibacterium beveridgei TaxID=632773 RepID=A0A1D7QXZ4_9BACI|nr:hypothetical protein BBEV_2535 [Salisediminibacterium beveridgei]
MDDVFLNFIGVMIGYVLFKGFVHIYQHLIRKTNRNSNPVAQYIDDVLKQHVDWRK